MPCLCIYPLKTIWLVSFNLPFTSEVQHMILIVRSVLHGTSGMMEFWMVESDAACPAIVLCWSTCFSRIFLFKDFNCLFYWMVNIIIAANKSTSSHGRCQPALFCHWKQGQGDRESNWCYARPHTFPWDVSQGSTSLSLSLSLPLSPSSTSTTLIIKTETILVVIELMG